MALGATLASQGCSTSHQRAAGPAAVALPRPDAGRVGSSLGTSKGGYSVQVNQVETPIDQVRRSVVPGARLTDIYVEVCVNGIEAGTRTWQPTMFTLQTSDNHRWAPATGNVLTPAPRFVAKAIPTGTCEWGWITFQPPQSDRVASVIWDDPSEQLQFRWQI